MSRDTTVIPFRQPEAIDDPLSELAREGARRMLAQVLIAEANSFVAMWKDLKLPDGRDRVVRHGHGPHRAIQTGVGPVEVRRAKVRDRGDVGAEEKIRFTSSILPKWARRTKSLDALLPVLYLRGVSTGDFQEALAALLGKEAPNLSPAVISRLTAEWQAEYDAWQKRDLSARRYVYVWADGVYLQARMEEAAECMLVLIGATPEGKKELVGFQTGVREGAQSWRELLIDIKKRGLEIAPDLAVGDGARLLEGDRGGLSEHQAPALLGSQDRQRAEQGRPHGPGQHEGRHSRDLRRADPRGGRGSEVNLPVLAKLMLAERFMPRLFDQIAYAAAAHPKGVCEGLAALEAATADESDTGKGCQATGPVPGPCRGGKASSPRHPPSRGSTP